MGMINYLGKFIPNLSARNQPLRQFLENKVQERALSVDDIFMWGDNEQKHLKYLFFQLNYSFLTLQDMIFKILISCIY